ncbi:MAG: cupin domain-containing protein [Gammaproteobacteria bacterium]|nr:cupin domain-containing protein [Gammaproteobacteria bacterium]
MSGDLIESQQTAAFTNDDQEQTLNADFSVVAFVSTEQQNWQSSPMPGVWRKRLELIGKELPQLTTLVRFEPDSYFEAHEHDGGEEFLVLEGVFSDISGDYGKGFYVRNPPGSRHRPYTKQGCTILVKLRQFLKNDMFQFSVDTNTSNWSATSFNGIKQLLLHDYEDEQVMMYRFDSQSEPLSLTFQKIVEVMVVEGDLQQSDNSLVTGDWIRFPKEFDISLKAENQALIWVKIRG